MPSNSYLLWSPITQKPEVISRLILSRDTLLSVIVFFKSFFEIFLAVFKPAYANLVEALFYH
jgi:hypothetical protein